MSFGVSCLSAIAAAAVLTSVSAAMDPYFSTGPVASDSFIREPTSTLVLPQAPSGSSGDLSLWVGVGTSKGDLIQSIANNWQSSDWAVFAYTLLETGPNSQMPVEGQSSTTVPFDQVTMHSMAMPKAGGGAHECAVTSRGTVPAHSWTNTEIILDVADPTYIDTLYKASGVTGDMTTTDAGKTWTASTINIPQYTF